MLGRIGRAVYAASCAGGVHHLGRRSRARHLLVIAYHGLRDREPPPGTSWSLLPVSEFERQVRYLREHYRVLPIDEAVERLRSGTLRTPTACITFDDGYRSNRALALPVLQRLGVPATIYLPTGMIGTPKRLWTIALDLMFQQTRVACVDLGAIGPGPVPLGDAPQRARVARQVIGRLKRLPSEEREAAVARVQRELALETIEDGGAYALMSWEEVREMEASGVVTFGAHTVNHEILSRLSDARVVSEVRESVACLARNVERPSRTFAYPNGTAADFDSRAIAAVRASGCIGAVSTIEGLSGRHTDRYAVRRFNIGSDMSFDSFRLLTSGVLQRRTAEAAS